MESYEQLTFEDYLLQRSCEPDLYYRERQRIVEAFFDWHNILTTTYVIPLEKPLMTKEEAVIKSLGNLFKH